jgi:hypothetical protein
MEKQQVEQLELIIRIRFKQESVLTIKQLNNPESCKKGIQKVSKIDKQTFFFCE